MANMMSLISLVLITIFYFVVKEMTMMNKLSPNVRAFLPVLYLIVMIIVQLGTNYVTLNNLCKNVNMGTLIFATAIPWVTIFGVLLLALQVLPGWKAPFSNTIGYLFISGYAKELIPKIFKGKMDGKQTGAAAEALEYIYDDQSLLINEITPSNFDAFWLKMESGNLINRTQASDDYKSQLRGLVKRKDDIATAIWYLMTGFLVTSYSYHMLVSAKCEKKVKEHNKDDQDYIDKMKSKAESQVDKKVYTSKE